MKVQNIYETIDGLSFLKVEENLFVQVEENIYKKSDRSMQNYRSLYRVETAKEIEDFYNDYRLSDEATLTIYSPRLSNGYIGYLGKTYYQDFLIFESTSQEAILNERANPLSYFGSTMRNAVNFVVDAGLNYVTQGTWSIAKIFLPDVKETVASYDYVVHAADKYETKYKKLIYLLEGVYFLGSSVEYSIVKFENFIKTPSHNGQRYAGNVVRDTHYTEWYTRAEERAYKSYLIEPYIERISSYKYGDAVFDSLG